MNKQEIVEKIKEMTVETFFSGTLFVKQKEVIKLIEQLDEPQAGHAEEAPRYVKNIIARLRELPLHDREVWSKAIMSEFEQDFSRAKWREGYEQGKFDGMLEREKVKIPQFVADIIEKYKEKNAPILDIFDEKYLNERYRNWLISSLNAYDRAARAWLDGYEVEKTKEALYTVTLKSSGQKLFYHEKDEEYLFSNYAKCFLKEHHTRKELEQSGFGWVFDCPGIEVEEVQDD